MLFVHYITLFIILLLVLSIIHLSCLVSGCEWNQLLQTYMLYFWHSTTKICYIYLLYSYVRHPWLHVIFSITYSNSSANDLVRVLLKNFIKSEKTPAELTRVTNGGWFCKYLSAVQEFSLIFIEQGQYTEGWWHFTVYMWILGGN